jgi:hypothetical protein
VKLTADQFVIALLLLAVLAFAAAWLAWRLSRASDDPQVKRERQSKVLMHGPAGGVFLAMAAYYAFDVRWPLFLSLFVMAVCWGVGLYTAWREDKARASSGKH